MQIKIIEGRQRETCIDEMEEAYRLRHRIFVEEARWEKLRRNDGMERDEFDDENSVNFLLYEHDRLIGYSRLLPTTRPYLLTRVYPHLCEGQPPSSPTIFEWTRFGVDRAYRGDGRGLGQAGAMLVHAYVEWGLRNGVEAVVVELAPSQVIKFIQCHFLAYPLGITHMIDGQETVAVVAHFDERTQRRLKLLLASDMLTPKPAESGRLDKAS